MGNVPGERRLPRHGQTRRLNGDLYHYDRHRAERVVDFFHYFLHFTQGEFAGRPFQLQKWQADELIRPFFGWLREDDTRQYREVYCETPKKSGKTELVAGFALNAVMNDDEEAPEVYSCASDRNQASLAWMRAAMMVEMEPELASRLETFPKSSSSYQNRGQKQIAYGANHGFYTAISSESYSKHGYNVSACIFDEFHMQPNAELYRTMKNGTAARRQPQFIIITNAGADRTSICWQKHKEAEAVMRDQAVDPELLGVIYGSNPDDDWTSPKVWRKANPSYGKTVSKSFYEAEVRRAIQNPIYENDTRRFFLGQWVSQTQRWMPMHRWDKCETKIDFAALEGRHCWAGLDLAKSQDLNALVLIFPPVDEEDDRYYVLPYAWMPEEVVDLRVKEDDVRYDLWIKQGYLETTPGDVTDYWYIRKRIYELLERYVLRRVKYDSHFALETAIELNQHYEREYPRVDGGDTFAVPQRQGYALSAGMTELLRLVLDGKIAHDGNPVLRWALDNMIAKRGRNGELMPDKEQGKAKIDPGVALIMAMMGAMEGEGPNREKQARRPNPYNRPREEQPDA